MYLKPIFSICLGISVASLAQANPFLPSCKVIVENLNTQKLHYAIRDTEQLANTLSILTLSHELPNYYVTKKEAFHMGWRRGDSLWQSAKLQGKMIGGDHFGNFEGKLPKGQWQEADIDYSGGHRNAKRLIFSSRNHLRYLTVDHYRTFYQVPACQ